MSQTIASRNLALSGNATIAAIHMSAAIDKVQGIHDALVMSWPAFLHKYKAVCTWWLLRLLWLKANGHDRQPD